MLRSERLERNREYWRRMAPTFKIQRETLKTEKRKFVRELKLEPCTDCGKTFIAEAMTFDHRFDEEKLYDIYRLTNHPTAHLDKLKAEIQKCDLVCVGCHRDRSNDRLQDYVVTCPKHRPTRVVGCRFCIHYVSLARLRAKRLALVRDFKNQPCIDCCIKYDPWKMDFDHVNDKCDNISNLVGSQASLTRIVNEIHKCEVVCCWCHVTRTVKRLGEYHE